jgi:hypothetical protein
MSQVKKPKPYSGILLTPIPLSSAADYLSKDEAIRARVSSRTYVELSKRLDALLKHYEVAPGDYAALVVALAAEHVPGFKLEERKRIEPKRQKGGSAPVDYFAIAHEVLRLVRDEKVTQVEACKRIAKKRTFGDLSWSSIHKYFRTTRARTSSDTEFKKFFWEQMKIQAAFHGEKPWGEK